MHTKFPFCGGGSFLSNKKRRLIISDTPVSAISTSSRIWAERFGAELIFALEYSSLNALLDAMKDESEWILFSWRGCLENLLKDRFLVERLNLISKSAAIYFSVPDHIDISNKIDRRVNPIYGYADGFTVVSNRLQASYETFPGIKSAPRYLPDFPNINLLSEISQLKIEKMPNSVIWVGNSRWGKRAGFTDHKGYRSIFCEVVAISKLRNLSLNFTVIDRGKSFLPHRKTLIEIAKSEILLQTSSSEGTGLPLLEALALGTYPISTDVGVNREVLAKDWKDFHASTPEDFLEAILSHVKALDSSKLREIYSNYIARCSEVIESFSFSGRAESSQLDECREEFAAKLGFDLKVRIRWRLRYLRNQLQTTRQGNP